MRTVAQSAGPMQPHCTVRAGRVRALLLCLLLRALSSSKLVGNMNHFTSLLDSFVGKFSNVEQAAHARLLGKVTAAEGGHELVSVCIARHPSETNVLVAAYNLGTFNEKPPFRFRYYKFEPVLGEKNLEGSVITKMKLYRPLPETELTLKEHSYDLKRYLPDMNAAFEYLEHCDIQWTHIPDKDSDCEAAYYHGTLVEGQCTVCSQSDASVKLLIKDDLRVFRDALWICDRAYTASGKQVIGNVDGVPYKLKKY